MSIRVDQAQAEAGLVEIQARQQQAAVEGLRTPRWFVVAVAGLVLAMSVAVDLLGSPRLLQVVYVVVFAGLAVAAERQRRVKVHRSWYTPGRVALMAGVTAVVAVGMAVTVAVGQMLAARLVGEHGPHGLVAGGFQAVVVLLMVSGLERVWLAVTRRGVR